MKTTGTTAKISSILPTMDDVPTSFEEYLDLYAAPVGEVINTYIPHNPFYEINHYLYDPIRTYSENGGKRHRPLICFASCLAVGGDVDKATTSAAAIEHFQTAALIHDDIADESELRRGAPCLHLTEGVGPAINMGDLALMLVNGTIVGDGLLDDALKVRLLGELSDMTRRTIEGQALDLGWARDERYDISVDDYVVMAKHKTAHYSGAVPLAVGAIVGGASEAQVEALREYGLATGLAFQIQDDLLNLIGREESAKKDFRSDITEGKRTMVVVHALGVLDGADRARLIEILSSKARDLQVLDEAVALLERAGSIEFARAYAEDLIKSAKVRLREQIAPSPARDMLESMGDWFVNRLG